MILIPLLIILLLATFLFILKKYFDDIKVSPPTTIDALISSEELNRHAEELAHIHRTYGRRKNYTFLFSRLKDDYDYISNTHQSLNRYIKSGAPLCPASEWLLDNFYIIEEHYKDIKKNSSKDFFKGLRLLSEGNYKGYPRVFAIALELISHTDGRIDKEQLINFINSYQAYSNLSMVELWALCPMVKIALIEKIRCLCEKITATQNQWTDAEKAAESDISKAMEIITRNFESSEEISYSFVEHFFRISKNKDQQYDTLLNLIHDKLLDRNTNLDKTVEQEHRNQAAMQVSIGNCISSLRLVISLDWPNIFELLSSVERTLKNDPSGIYLRQDYASRDYYRHKIEVFSKTLNVSETAVARKAVYCADMFCQDPNRYPSNHVGYYIAGKGKNRLMAEIDSRYKDTPYHARSPFMYILPVALLTLLISVGLAAYCYWVSSNMLISVICFIILLIPGSEVAVTAVNFIVTHTVEPTFLPKIEYGDCLPDSAATAVIIPTILPNANRAEQLIKNLEIIYLANKCENIYFALLGDYKDAAEQSDLQDAEISGTVISMIDELNRKYAVKHDLFYFFIRKRIYSKQQDRWMGWERKRGAILEFNRLLRDCTDHTFCQMSENIEPLKKAKYVITLDADTTMPIGAAKRLIGTISHPLNAAVVDGQKKIVIQGYGIIQPRIGISVECSNKSLFSRIFAGYGGIDPYTNAISDVYQDLFDEGIFTGKGIYDVDVFNECLGNAIPDHTVLSHDLLESSYIRAGLATDIELIDGCPEKYNSYILRLHRWVRGDWQIMGWLLPYIKDRKGQRIPNPISILSRWKIFDNLRRSIMPTGFTVLFFSALLFLPGTFLWLGLGLLFMFFSVIIGLIDFEFLPKQRLNRNLIYGIKSAFYQQLIQFVLLPHMCYMMANAVFKTLYRMSVSRRNLLEWVTASDVEKNVKNTFESYFRLMAVSLWKVILLPIAVYFFMPENLTYSLILAVIWLLSPYCAYKISQNEISKPILLSEEDQDYLRKLCRKTWAFYEDFAGEDNHFLPADNYQIKPIERIAHRTSPTNIGFLLMAILSARDLGYITLSFLYERLDNTIRTIENLPKWNGHLYNWYDTKTLEILHPAYISTVDSGNLVSYYITVKQGLMDHLSKPVLQGDDLKGLKDTLELYSDEKNQIVDDLLSRKALNLKNWYGFIRTAVDTVSQERRIDPKIYNTLTRIKNELERFYPDFIIKDDLPDKMNAPVYENLKEMIRRISPEMSAMDLSELYQGLLDEIEMISSADKKDEDAEWLDRIKNETFTAASHVNECINLACSLEKRLEQLIASTDFVPLFDKNVGLFSIGYNIEANELTNSHYDLLASEARITSYIAACRGNIPVSHWFKLGRTLVTFNGYRALVSWTATMFEYLMPPIVMKTFKNTLLDETYHTVVKAQIAYGQKRDLPWGTSESGYNTFDFSLNYQYKAFGVPGIGLKRGLIQDMVVSPYSTILALPYAPVDCIKNLRRLSSLGSEGKYGLYEAIDFTPNRMLLEEDFAIVNSFMAHHQGMIFNVLNNYLNDNIMVTRFHSEPLIKAGEYLLQEKIPVHVIITNEHKEAVEPFEKKKESHISYVRKTGLPASPLPACHMLSNGSFSTLLTDRGTGYSKFNDILVTRWREDAVSNKSGCFFFIKNVNTGQVWSSSFGPLNEVPSKYEVKFSSDKGEYTRQDGDIETHTQICVSPEDNGEVRTVTLSNYGNEPVVLECTSYFEVTLSNAMADIAHPAFNNLFIQTEALKEYNSLLASRRSRDEKSKALWAFHTVSVDGECISDFEFETDRYKFIGRGNDITDPDAMDRPLSNTAGAVLDPVMSIRRRVRIIPGAHAKLCYSIGTADNRSDALELAKKYNECQNITRVFELAYIRSQITLQYLDLNIKDMEFFDSMISHITHLSPLRRNVQSMLQKNKLGQQGLWPYGISGDLPIVLITIDKTEDLNAVKRMVKAHEYLRMKGLKVDFVVLNEDKSDYLQPLQNALKDIIQGGHSRDTSGGSIYTINASLIPDESKTLLFTTARLVLHARKYNLESQIKTDIKLSVTKLQAVQSPQTYPVTVDDDIIQNLAFFNSYGGFDIESSEYVIYLKEGMNTPAPWSNIIANEQFGCLITESGSGYTWSENSRENKLTPWPNDAVSDTPSETIYIRDDQSNYAWTMTPLPMREKEPYTIRHGQGYTSFKHISNGIAQEMSVFVAHKEPVKIYLVKLKNESDTKRNLTLFYYLVPVLSPSEQLSQPYILTEQGQEQSTLLIKNGYNQDFAGRTAFAASSEVIKSYTSDRMEFLGLHGSSAYPRGITKESLSNSLGSGFYPCCAMEVSIDLDPNETKEIAFLLGQVKDEKKIRELVEKYTQIENCKSELVQAKKSWKDMTHKIQVKTPDLTMDLMINSFLLYQTFACRIMARSAFYQSGGAYGFRDQLQDVLSMVYALPEVTRAQILKHCAHQFEEGDVLHWWHPLDGEKGVRTKFSDDLLWLAFVTGEYIEKTGDLTVLDEEVPYIKGELLKEDQDEHYQIPEASSEKSSVYEHCIRAIERSLKFGDHNLPLMGSGDWNDGMSTVGNKGNGESVWVGWFLYTILKKFIPLCQYKKDIEKAEKYRDAALQILRAIEENAWDGEWYRRAYFDDGTPLGSATNTECRIDSLCQSWAVISGGGDPDRIIKAMSAVDDYLIKREEGLIMLLTPPFDNGKLKPGYIKGYVPGVRENGGQYTHAAVWVISAFAKMGLGDKSHELFNLINPINHTLNQMQCDKYKVEPYVMPADVYSVEPHTGRGGWTWYTGTSSWMYKVGLEDILGFKKQGNTLKIMPCIPADWDQYSITYRYEETPYQITVHNPEGKNTGVTKVTMDGKMINDGSITLINDGQEHVIDVVM